MSVPDLTVDEVLATTRAVRRRLDLSRTVDDALVLECVELALQAPSSSNNVSMQFVVVKEPSVREAIAAIYAEVYESYQRSTGYPGRAEGEAAWVSTQARVARSAEYLAQNLGRVPVLVIGCTVGSDRAAATADDGNILPAMWSFMLAARARGLGTAWTSMHLAREREVADVVGIPYDTVAQWVLTPLAHTLGHEFGRAKRPRPDEVIHWDRW